jgi:carbonic anhydrase/acetyltransferase-like protein (isoleucine patch superfamily)
MEIYPYLNYHPQIGERVYISPGAKVIGRAFLADDVSVWFNSVVRADVNKIEIGKNSNIQDLCMLHVTEKNALIIGEGVSLGHSVVLHGCRIGHHCLIGMGAIILDGADIGDYSVVAAGSLVSPGKKFPPGSLIKGRPAVVERALSQDEKDRYGFHYQSYLEYKNTYLGQSRD